MTTPQFSITNRQCVRAAARLLLTSLWLLVMPPLLANDLLVSFRLIPEAPQAGQDFSVLLTVPNLDTRNLKLEEPQLATAGSPVFIFRGGSIRPLQGMALPAVILQYDFASAAFSGVADFVEDIISFAVLVDGRKRDLGAWRLALPVAAALRTQTVLQADWIIADSAWQYQSLSGHIALSGGSRLPLPLVPSLEGVLFDFVPGQMEFLVAARHSFALPALEFEHEGRKIRLREKTVQLKPLPEGQAAPAALGVYKASFATLPDVVKPGDRLVVQLRIDGLGSPLFLREPELVIVFQTTTGTSSMLDVPVVHRYQHFVPSRNGWQGQSIVQYDLQAELPGSYSFSLADWLVLDTDDGSLHAVSLAPLRVRVERPVEKPAQLPETLRQQVADLAVASESLPADIRARLMMSAGMVPFPVARFKDLSEEQVLGLAARLLLEDRKQAALNLLLQLQRTFRPSPATVPMAGFAAAALAQPGLNPYISPSPWLILIFLVLAAGLASLALFLAMLARWRLARLQRSRTVNDKTNALLRSGYLRWQRSSLILILLTLVLAGFLSFAMLERRPAVLVSNSESVRSIPTAEGRLLFVAPIGLAGKVRNQAGNWYFVEYSDGRSGWINATADQE